MRPVYVVDNRRVFAGPMREESKHKKRRRRGRGNACASYLT